MNCLNDVIWPDFPTIKLANGKGMSLTYQVLELGKDYSIGEHETLRAFQTDHTVDSCGYVYKKNEVSALITADTYSLDSMIHEVNNDNSIKSIVVECSFPSSMESLAKESKHLTPKLLFKMLENLKSNEIKLYINHIKPSFLVKIVSEIEEYRGEWKPIILKDGDFVNF